MRAAVRISAGIGAVFAVVVILGVAGDDPAGDVAGLAAFGAAVVVVVVVGVGTAAGGVGGRVVAVGAVGSGPGPVEAGTVVVGEALVLGVEPVVDLSDVAVVVVAVGVVLEGQQCAGAGLFGLGLDERQAA
jgi:hypothetical protein